MKAYELPPDAGRSWWLRDALADDPGEPAPPLTGDTTADVVILGGGYTGMWTAFFLKEAEPDLDIVLLEQDICGGGPSGRNGGFLNSWWSRPGRARPAVRRSADARALQGGRGEREGDRRVLHGERHRRLVPPRRGPGSRQLGGPDRLLGRQRHGRRPSGPPRPVPRGGSRHRPRADRHAPPAWGDLHADGRHRAARPAGPRDPTRAAGTGREDLRADAGDAVRRRLARDRRDARWCGARGLGGRGPERLGRALEAVPPSAHGSRQLHRAHRSGAGEARGAPVGPTGWACGITEPRCTTCGPRRTEGSRSGSAACSPGWHARSDLGSRGTSVRSAWRPTTCTGCSRRSRTCRSRRRGAAR